MLRVARTILSFSYMIRDGNLVSWFTVQCGVPALHLVESDCIPQGGKERQITSFAKIRVVFSHIIDVRRTYKSYRLPYLLTPWRQNPKVHHRIHNSTPAIRQRIRPGPTRCDTFRNRLEFLRCEVVSPPAQPPSWRTTPCRLSETAYSIYSQLPSIPGVRLLQPQREDAPCRGDKGPT
jgi:hypothetical protein